MHVRAQSARTIDAPPRAVFAVLADPWSYVGWVCGTHAVRAADPQWPAPGARLWHRFGRRPLRSFGVTCVLECVPPYRLVLRAHAPPLALVVATITVQADGVRSLVRLHEDMVAGPLRWFGPVTALAQHWRNRSSLRQLALIATRTSHRMTAKGPQCSRG